MTPVDPTPSSGSSGPDPGVASTASQPAEPGPDSIGPWLEAFRAGRTDAGQRLLTQFEPWLRVLARHQMESRFQAKFDPADVVQQTMLEAVRAAGQFRGRTGAEFAAWLRQILSHVLAHEIRRYAGTAKRDLGREVSLEQELTQTDARLGDLLAASGATPSRDAARRDDASRLARALDQLPGDDRAILLLRHVDGLSHEEIARRLNKSAGAIRMAWVRALTRLRAAMLKLDPPAGA
jgi:RNA polymerase sigma-70 factor (ECF subfamily)